MTSKLDRVMRAYDKVVEQYDDVMRDLARSEREEELASLRRENELLREGIDDAISALSSVYEKAGEYLWKSKRTEPGHVCDYRGGLQSSKDVAKRALQRLGEVRKEARSCRDTEERG